MKTVILSTIIAFFSLVNTQAQVDKTADTQENYIVLTRKIPQLKPILITAQKLKAADGDKFGNFEVVICGKTVRQLPDSPKMEDFLKQAKQSGADIHACGFSLQKFGVEHRQLPEGMDVVKNGILYNFNKQKQGYHSIEL